MKLIVILFIFAFAIAVFSNLDFSFEGLKEYSQLQDDSSQEQPLEKETIPKYSGLAAITGTKLIDTHITAGPEEGETIEETNIVTFEFEEELPPGGNQGRVYFETKIEGLDDDWKKTSSRKVALTLPPGHTLYTFLVRAITGDSVDPTPAERTFKANNSPYFGKVRISSVNPPYSSYRSTIRLSIYLNDGEEINITGWQVEGRMGKATIPEEIDEYLLGQSSDNNIIVKQGDIVSLSSGRGPLGKKTGYRLNKCLGYLTKSSSYSLPLPGSCPKPTKEEISHLNPCCQEFILRIGGCEIPDYSWNSKIYQDSECLSYLERNFNYNGCIRSHIGDRGFLLNTWHVFLNIDVATADFCDTIYLRDQNGFFVDKYDYGRDVCR